MKKLLLIPFFFILFFGQAQEMITDRPDQTESPMAVKPGEVQVEAGYLAERYADRGPFSIKRRVLPSSLFRIGLAKRLELRVVSEFARYEVIDDRVSNSKEEYTGFENMQLGFKYQFNPGDQALVVGFMAHLVVPSGSEGLNDKYYGMISRFNFNYAFDENKNLGLNLGYNHLEWTVDEEGFLSDSDGEIIYTLTYGVGLGEKVGLYVEAFGEYINFKRWRNNMDMGFTYLLRENVQLDYSFGWGLDQNMNYQSLGISFRLPK